jgi:hypothetical protein
VSRLSDYAENYEKIRFERTSGVLEITLHTRGGEALWGASDRSLHNELGHAFSDIARDPDNRVVLLTGTGRSTLRTDPRESCREMVCRLSGRCCSVRIVDATSC